MKKKILVLVMFVFCLFGLVACEEAVAPKGEKGEKGATGKSAYEIAVENGFDGDVAAWLESLKGAEGQKGKTGPAGENGTSGQNANEIVVFTEDGGLYWHYVDGNGKQVGEDQLLYYFQDYITITYSKKEFETVDEVIAAFLSDLSKAYGSEITAANFYDTFHNDGMFMGNKDGTKYGIMADNPSLFNKYKFLIQWVYDYLYSTPSSSQFFSNDTSHKYELATLELFGIDCSWENASSSRSNHLNHGNYNIVANIANFMNLNNEATGTSDYYPAGDFTGVDRSSLVAGGIALMEPVQVKRADLATYQLVTFEKSDDMIGDGYVFDKWVDAKGIEVKNGSIPNHTQELFIVTHYDGIYVTLNVDYKSEEFGFSLDPLTHVSKDAGIPDPEVEGYVFLGWVDENGKAVKVGGMMDGHTYQATWRKNNTIKLDGGWSVNGLGREFCADLSVLVEKEVTPENFFETFADGGLLQIGFVDETITDDSADGSEQGLKLVGGLVKNEAFMAKWGWYLSFISSKVTNKYAATAFALAGLPVGTESRVTTYPHEASRLAVGTISNALSAQNIARNEYNPCLGFNSQDMYEGLDQLVYANMEGITDTMKADLTYTGDANEYFVFFKEGVEFGGYSANGANPILFNKISEGLTYRVYWATQVEIDLNGGYVYSVEGVQNALLGEINKIRAAANLDPIKASEFYASYKSDAATGPLDDLIPALKENYEWLLNYIVSGKWDNKRMKGICTQYGLEFNHEGSSPVVDGFSHQFLANWIHNFLNGIGDNLHGGNPEYYPAKDFSGENAYEGLEVLAVKNNVVDTTVFAFAKDVAALVASMQYLDHEFLGFYDKADETEALVEYADMKLAGHVYVAKWAGRVLIDFDGGYIFSFSSMKKEFLADVSNAAGNEVSAENFYETFSEKFMNVTAYDSETKKYSVGGLCAEHPELITKWGWLIEYIGSVMGNRKYGNTALVAFGLHSAKDDNLVTSSLNYADRTITNSIHNFLTGTGANLHGGSSSGAVPADFSGENAYAGLPNLAVANGFAVGSYMALTREVPEIAASVEYPHHRLLGFYDKADANKTLLEVENMNEAGHTYVAKWEAATVLTAGSVNTYTLGMLREQFLADLSAAAGKEITAENFFSTFKYDGSFMGGGTSMGTSGIMATNPELFAKYKVLIQAVYDYLYSRPSDDVFFSNSTSHKYELATLEAFGIDSSGWSKKSSSRSENLNNGNRNIVANIANFLNLNNAGTGTSSSYPVGNFTGADVSSILEACSKSEELGLKPITGTYDLYSDDAYYPKRANAILFENGKYTQNRDYINPKWSYENYKSVDNGPWQWYEVTGVQMRSRKSSGGTDVINMAGGYGLPYKFTFNKNGEALGVANKLSFKLGNYFNNVGDTQIKIGLIDTNGDVHYLYGDADNWATLAYGTDVTDWTKTFDAINVQSIFFTFKNPNGGTYIYVSADAVLTYEE